MEDPEEAQIRAAGFISLVDFYCSGTCSIRSSVSMRFCVEKYWGRRWLFERANFFVFRKKSDVAEEYFRALFTG